MALTAGFAGRASWASSFQYRDFRLLWGSTLFHALGFGMENVSLGWLVLEMTDSPFMVGVSAAARMAPFFFLGILSGAIADRVDRRLFLRFITLSGSIVAGLMALILILDVAQVWHVIVLAGAMGCYFAITLTVRQAYTFDVVGAERALNGMALTGVSQQIGGLAGAVLAGWIISEIGIGGQYLAIASTYVAAAAVLLAVHDAGQAAPTQRDTVVGNLRGYVSLLRQNRTLMTLMLLTAATEVFGFTHMSLLPVFAKEVLGVGALGLGFMTAVRQVGGTLALVLMASLGDFKRKGMLMFVFSTSFGLGQMAFSLTDNIFFFLVVLAFVNGCAMSVDTLYRTLMQANVPNEQRGRAMGSWVLSIGVAPPGHLAVGAMAGALGAPGALLINGSILAFVSVSSAISLPRIRRLE